MKQKAKQKAHLFFNSKRPNRAKLIITINGIVSLVDTRPVRR
jgi:hypothetical protein